MWITYDHKALSDCLIYYAQRCCTLSWWFGTQSTEAFVPVCLKISSEKAWLIWNKLWIARNRMTNVQAWSHIYICSIEELWESGSLSPIKDMLVACCNQRMNLCSYVVLRCFIWLILRSLLWHNSKTKPFVRDSLRCSNTGRLDRPPNSFLHPVLIY